VVNFSNLAIRTMLEAERAELERILQAGGRQHLGVLERSLDRRAIRARIMEIEVELSDPVELGRLGS